METILQSFNSQLITSLKLTERLLLQPLDFEPAHIVLAGMGGSGIGANIVQTLYQEQLKQPLLVVKNYHVPNFVCEQTLFIACSFSGNTEEIISATGEAHRMGAKIIIISKGGKLKEIAQKEQIDFVEIPHQGPMCPRGNLGFSFTILLGVLAHLKLIDQSFREQIHAFLRNTEDLLAEQKTLAQQFTTQVFEKNILIYSDTLLAPIALRFQQQINENAKQFAHINIFPELNHNELVGWRFPVKFWEQTALFLMDSGHDHFRTQMRMKISRQDFEQAGATVIDLPQWGTSLLEQYLHHIVLTDWLSYYLALANDVDPFPVEPIDRLKRELALINQSL